MRLRITHIIIVLLSFFLKANGEEPFTKKIWLNETNIAIKVNCITQDESGYIWLGTEDGLYRYDGTKFTQCRTITNNDITAITASGNNIWTGFRDGTIGIYKLDSFYQKSLAGDTIREAISSIQVIQGQNLIVSTYGEGLFYINAGRATQYNNNSGLSDNYVYSIAAPEKNSLLVATDHGVNALSLLNGIIKVKSYTTQNGLADNIVTVIRPMKKKCWSWIGSQQGGIALYCKMFNTVWTPNLNSLWQWGGVKDILPLEDKHALICTDAGYILDAVLKDSTHLSITPHHYPNEKLNKIIEDKTGNIWIATNSGLLLSTYNYMKKVTIPHPFSLPQLTTMVVTETCAWLAMGNKLYCYTFSTNQLEQKFTSEVPISNLHIDDNNTLWIGTFGNGLWYKKGQNSPQKVTHITTLKKESVLDIAHTNKHLWVAGLNGIAELSIGETPNQLKLYQLHNKNTGVGSDYVYQISTDKQSNIWMATDGAGVCMYNGKGYTHWDSSQGMVSNVVYSITEDTSGNIWAATLNKGLLKYDGEAWQQYNKRDGIQDINISSVGANNTGQVFITSAKGVDIWQPKQNQFRSINKRMSVGIDSLSDILKLTSSSTDGDVYIPYQEGLIKFSSNNKVYDVTPKVVITGVSTFFHKTPFSKKEFKHSENYISFNFNGINLTNNEPLYYRYQLKGYNDMWIETGDQSVTFPQLPSGDYTFCVQVSTSRSFNNFSEAKKAFHVGKPFYLQIWFFILVGTIIWGIAYTYVKIKERNLRKVNSLQKERMLFEYEHLKSQVNPHFLFNSLNTLTTLIENEDDAALRYTNQLSDLYRNMLSYRNKDSIALEEEWEIMNNYLYIQKSRFGNALQFETNVDEETRQKRQIVPMALQLLLENAIKHNIVSMHQPLKINISTNADSLIIRNTYQPKISKEKGAGLGLANIRKRYSLLTNKRVISGIENDEFVVVIPLL